MLSEKASDFNSQSVFIVPVRDIFWIIELRHYSAEQSWKWFHSIIIAWPVPSIACAHIYDAHIFPAKEKWKCEDERKFILSPILIIAINQYYSFWSLVN